MKWRSRIGVYALIAVATLVAVLTNLGPHNQAHAIQNDYQNSKATSVGGQWFCAQAGFVCTEIWNTGSGAGTTCVWDTGGGPWGCHSDNGGSWTFLY